MKARESDPEADIEAAWRQEVAARVAALEPGQVAITPWEEIRDGFLARLSGASPGLLTVVASLSRHANEEPLSCFLFFPC